MLGRLFGRKSGPAESAAVEAPPCSHADLAARWDDAADMGKEDRVSSYSCNSCGATLTPDQAEAARSANRARDLLS